MNERINDAHYFLNLIQKSKRGKFKIYIGMIAGVGKTCRMLRDAKDMLKDGIDIAKEAILSGKAKEKLEQIIKVSNQLS